MCWVQNYLFRYSRFSFTMANINTVIESYTCNVKWQQFRITFRYFNLSKVPLGPLSILITFSHSASFRQQVNHDINNFISVKTDFLGAGNSAITNMVSVRRLKRCQYHQIALQSSLALARSLAGMAMNADQAFLVCRDCSFNKVILLASQHNQLQ